jgi:hypothetical protein
VDEGTIEVETESTWGISGMHLCKLLENVAFSDNFDPMEVER